MLALLPTSDPDSLVTIGEVPEPSPAAHEAIVSVHAVSLNRGEVSRLLEPPKTWRPGWDFAGQIEVPALDGTGPPAGTSVVGFVWEGAWAQKVSAPASALAALPADVSMTDAAALPVAGLTALGSLRLAGQFVGKKVLIIGASGGVGRFAVQLAARAGAAVHAVARNSFRMQGLKELGASEIVSSVDEAQGLFDVILDSVGGEVLAQCMAKLAPYGDLICLGHSAKTPTTFLSSEFFPRRGRMHGFRLGTGTNSFPERGKHPEIAAGTPENFSSDLSRLLRLVERNELDPQIASIESWRNSDPFIRLLDRKVNGKIVLQID